VFLQNPNGLHLSGATLALQHDLQLSCDYGVAALCMPETNTDWELPHLRSSFSTILRKTWRNSMYVSSKSPEEFLLNSQPGGTATVICENWTSHVIDRGEDPLGLGRWSYVTLHGKGTTKVTVVTAYNATTSSVDTTNFQQQQHVLSRLHREHNQHGAAQPRRQFILDFQGWLESRIDDGHELIVGMDVNDTFSPDAPGTRTQTYQQCPHLITGNSALLLPVAVCKILWLCNMHHARSHLHILEVQKG
jgi:hypothetical protein